MHCYIVPGDGLSGWNRTTNAFLRIDRVLFPNITRHRLCVFVLLVDLLFEFWLVACRIVDDAGSWVPH